MSDFAQDIQYHKDCPKCGKVITYSSYDSLRNSIKSNRVCRSCSKKGMPNGRIGKKHSVETIEKMKLSAKNKPPVSNETKQKLSIARQKRITTPETREKLSKAFRGRKLSEDHKLKLSISNLGKTRSTYTKHKLRLATIHNLQKKGIVGSVKNHNPIACQFIDKLNEERGWNLQHAKNGGEIELYGYFADGYDKDKNIIFEYDEPEHKKRYKQQRDLIRQENLLKEIRPSLFLRYDESQDRLYEVK